MDTGRDIFSQLTSIFEDVSSGAKNKSDGPVESVNNDGDLTIVHINDPTEEVKTLFASKNMASLQQLGGGDILLELSTKLVFLSRYMQRYQEALKTGDFAMPSTINDVMTTRGR